MPWHGLRYQLQHYIDGDAREGTIEAAFPSFGVGASIRVRAFRGWQERRNLLAGKITGPRQPTQRSATRFPKRDIELSHGREYD
jgi:hypothetical protein